MGWIKVQGSGFRVQVAASPPFLEDGILVSQPSPLGNAIKLSGMKDKCRKRRSARHMWAKREPLAASL